MTTIETTVTATETALDTPVRRRALHARTTPRRWRRRSVVALLSTLAALGIGVGAAFAYFTTTGSGSGHGTVGTAVNATVSATTGTADLYPGGNGAAYFKVHNPNSVKVTFTKLTAASVVSNNTSACPNTNVSIHLTLTSPYAITAFTVAAGTTSAVEHISTIVHLTTNAPTTCQGVTFKVTLTLSGKLP